MPREGGEKKPDSCGHVRKRKGGGQPPVFNLNLLGAFLRKEKQMQNVLKRKNKYFDEEKKIVRFRQFLFNVGVFKKRFLQYGGGWFKKVADMFFFMPSLMYSLVKTPPLSNTFPLISFLGMYYCYLLLKVCYNKCTLRTARFIILHRYSEQSTGRTGKELSVTKRR